MTINLRHPLRSLATGLGLIASTTLLLSCGSPSSPPPASNAPTNSAPGTATSATGVADQAAAATNRYRVTKGGSALTRDSGLDALATEHAQTMARTGHVNHDGWASRSGRAGIEFGIEKANENVWRGLRTDPNQVVPGVMDFWANSKVHDFNLRDRATTHYGIGVVKSAEGYYNVVFISGAKR